ncbi:hypothetical protein WG947_01250 [Pontibacter sp. H259]|uniref:hypothetical protein n=1 Tax=Pontibacter sp. H259 TaxID=3133421 RepID=UPI0030BDDF49
MRVKQTIPAFLFLLLWAVFGCFSLFKQAISVKSINRYTSKVSHKTADPLLATVKDTSVLVSAICNWSGDPEVLYRQAHTSISGRLSLSVNLGLPRHLKFLRGCSSFVLHNLVQPNAP